jgi:hypothetical protein
MPIDPGKVQAAIELAGFRRVTDAARAMGLKQSTLDSILKRKPKQCTREVLSKIAKAVHIPIELLGPDVGYMPYLDYLQHVAWPDGGAEMPARSEVAIIRLGRKIMAAWLRDLRTGKTTIEEAFPLIKHRDRGEKANAEFLEPNLQVFLPELLGLWRWRTAYLRDTPSKVTFADAQDFTPAMAKAWETILTPWFDGKAELNHSAFAAFMQADPRPAS